MATPTVRSAASGDPAGSVDMGSFEPDQQGIELPKPPTFTTSAEERLHRKQQLAGAFRIFGRFGFGEGVAGHITVRDPEFTDLFRAALRPYIDMLVSRMREDIDAGLLRPDLDADGVVSLMLGAYLGELVRHGEVKPGWVGRTIDLLWMLMTPST